MDKTKIPVAGIILAAGKGTRMNSELPKVLHLVLGKTLLEHVVNTLNQSQIETICIVLSADIQPFASFLGRFPQTSICIQKNRLGTGDAVASAAPAFTGVKMPEYARAELVRGAMINAPYLLVCYGDTPSLRYEIISDFLQKCLAEDVDLGVIGMDHPHPKGYGRLILDSSNKLQGIIEEKDADEETKKITLCNTGITFGKTSFIFDLLQDLVPNNAQKEYYLTDCFALARERGKPAFVYITDAYRTFDGVNDQQQLAAAEDWAHQHP